MLLIGLTGSIGMGKSTTADIFRQCGVPVHDSDRAVHALYASTAVDPVRRLFPQAVNAEGVNRKKLAELILSDAAALKRLEEVVHPLVFEHRQQFVSEQISKGARRVVLDIPLLFETGADRDVDVVVVVSAPELVQKRRVLARPGMTQARFDAIVAKQMPDAEKRRRAHVVIDTGAGLDRARTQVDEFLRALAGKQ